MAILAEIAGHEKELGGGLRVRRLLPALARPSVGPFVFFDHFGPVTLPPGGDGDVRPHPHVGLATVSYLFEGALLHRDSLGHVQRIEPGAINWMHAGRGIVHSERRPPEERAQPAPLHGLQLWVALPRALEDSPPAFTHTPASALPERRVGDAEVRVLAGEAFGQRSPVVTASPTVYVALTLPPGGVLTVPPLAAQLAVYAVDGAVVIDGRALAPRVLAVVGQDRAFTLTAQSRAQLVLVGGEPPDGRRFLWWNFVASSQERLIAAADAWAAQRFGTIPGETEFIPLPDKRPGG